MTFNQFNFSTIHTNFIVISHPVTERGDFTVYRYSAGLYPHFDLPAGSNSSMSQDFLNFFSHRITAYCYAGTNIPSSSSSNKALRSCGMASLSLGSLWLFSIANCTCIWLSCVSKFLKSAKVGSSDSDFKLK